MEVVTFEVLTENVEVVGKGKPLPKGQYLGYVEWTTLGLSGHQNPHLAMAKIHLTRELLAAMGLRADGPDVDAPVAQYVKSGDIRIVEQ